MIAQLPTVAPSANYPEFLEALRSSELPWPDQCRLRHPYRAGHR